jgi:flagellar motor protein MotB
MSKISLLMHYTQNAPFKSSSLFFYISIFFTLLLCTSCSSNALPGQTPELEGFDLYIKEANEALARSSEDVKRAQATLAESKKLLEEARMLHASMKEIHQAQEKTLKKVKSERNAWEYRKKQEKIKAQELEEQLKKEKEEAKPTPLPYAPSDAPLNPK